MVSLLTESRIDAQPAERLWSGRLIVRPAHGPTGGIDVTDAVVQTIAVALNERMGGNDVLNRLEAERLLARVLHAGAR
jgi:hypothetical protein